MKNLKSLQVVALAGVAVALTAGCSSTSSSRVDSRSSDSNGAYRWVSSGGWVPITDAQKMVAFPPGWVPGRFGAVSYETYILTPPAVAADATTIGPVGTSGSTVSASDSSVDTHVTTASSTTTTTIASDGTATTTTTRSPGFSEDLQPGDTFVEAAGANSNSSGEVRRVILYTPFNTPGLGH